MDVRYLLPLVLSLTGCFTASVDLTKCIADTTKIPSQNDFDIHQFVGAWYTSSSTSYVYQSNIWKSMTNVIYVRKDGNVTGVTSGMSTYHQKCETAIIDFSEESTGRYSGSFLEEKVLMNVLHTDYTTAAMAYCFDLQPDGSCQHDKMQIEIWSRTLDGLKKTKLSRLESYMQNIECTRVEHMIPMEHGLCETAASSELLESTVRDNGGKPISDTDIFFYGEMPSGDYHTLYDAVQDGDIPTALNYKFIPSHNNQILYVTKSEQREDICDEIKVEKYRKIDDDHFLQTGESVPKELWFGKDRDVIAMFTCYTRQRGKCISGRMQALIQNNKPVSLVALQTFNNILVYMFQSKYQMFIDQHTDLCAVPDLLREVVQVADTALFNPSALNGEGHTTQMQTGTCNLNSITVDLSLNLRQLEGLWYEIARPMNVHNQFDSAVAYFHFNEDNTLQSSYSGSIDGKCAPAISTHTKHLEGSPHDAEMMAKINGPNDVFQYMNFKVVYYDGTYSVHYGCFAKDNDGNCLYAEASIYGRQPTIDDGTFDRILAMYPSLCLSPDFMQRTEHHVDCSDWVRGKSDQQSSQCKVQDIPVQSHVEEDQMVGVWHIIASRNGKASTVKIRREGDGLMVDLHIEKDGNCKNIGSVSMIRFKKGDKSGLSLSSLQNDKMQFYNTLKVIYTDYKLALLYECFDEDIHGSCSQKGIRVLMMSRTPIIDTVTRSVLESKLKMPCGDLSNLQTKTGHCLKMKSCKIVDIPAVAELDKERLSGIWYDIVGRRDKSAAFKYSLDEDGHLTVQITGLRNDGECMDPPTVVDMKAWGTGGNFLNMKMTPTKSKGFVPLKFLYTDYDNYTVAYICLDVLVSGECSAKGWRAKILGRTKTITEEKKEELMKYMDKACVSRDQLKTAVHKVDCSHVLQ